MITYKKPNSITGSVKVELYVYVDDKKVGAIKRVEGGFQYCPNGFKGGHIFERLQNCKNSLESL